MRGLFHLPRRFPALPERFPTPSGRLCPAIFITPDGSANPRPPHLASPGFVAPLAHFLIELSVFIADRRNHFLS